MKCPRFDVDMVALADGILECPKCKTIDPDTFERVYEILINKELIRENPNVRPKKRTVVELTGKGTESARKIKKGLEVLE